MSIERIKRFFQRQPVIYDLWADIRLQWAIMDYFDYTQRVWDDLMQQALLGFSGQKLDSNRTIQFYRFQRF